MSGPKYYTQFILTDEQDDEGNEFCGVVQLNQAKSADTEKDTKEIEGILARNFDKEQSQVRLISWSRLH